MILLLFPGLKIVVTTRQPSMAGWRDGWILLHTYEMMVSQCNSLKLPRQHNSLRSKWHPLFVLNCQMTTI